MLVSVTPWAAGPENFIDLAHVLFAECVRTYPTCTVNAQEWLHRLEVERQVHRREVIAPRHVPVTSKPAFRTNRVRAPLVDLYGFRPLVPELALLSPFEFVQYWEALPVKQPSEYDDEKASTLDEGR